MGLSRIELQALQAQIDSAKSLDRIAAALEWIATADFAKEDK